MNNLEFLELVIEATQQGTIRWGVGRSGKGVFFDKEYAGSYQCKVDGYLIDIFLEERKGSIWQWKRVKNSVAAILKVTSVDEGLTFSMTSDPDIATADICEPKFHYLEILYFLVMRSWNEYYNYVNFNKMYPKLDGEPRGVFPDGWRVSEIFSSRPVMEGL